VKIVTVACDCYADIAPAYQYLLRKNWPDCPYPVVYVTNSQKLAVKDPVHYLKGEDGYIWCVFCCIMVMFVIVGEIREQYRAFKRECEG
jgi:hypothetical protein